MTTICFKDGVLASDSALYDNGLIIGYVEKAWKLPDGTVIAGAGRAQDTAAFRRWVENGRPEAARPALDDSFEGVLISAAGRLTCYESSLVGYPWRPVEGCFALGSGRRIALGAMLAGASPQDACHIACRLDDGSGEPIVVLRLDFAAQSEAAE